MDRLSTVACWPPMRLSAVHRRRHWPLNKKGIDGRNGGHEYVAGSRLEREAQQAGDSRALISAMKAAFPGLPGETSLETSAKVIKWEMQWPAPAPDRGSDQQGGDTPSAASTAFPAVGKRVDVTFGETTFQLSFSADAHTMSFVGTAGPFKGVTDTVQYTAVQLRPQLFMVCR